jgi:hypothetical protein
VDGVGYVVRTALRSQLPKKVKEDWKVLGKIITAVDGGWYLKCDWDEGRGECGEEFSDHKQIKAHIEQEHQKTRAICKLSLLNGKRCGLSFSSNYGLQIHISQKHSGWSNGMLVGD